MGIFRVIASRVISRFVKKPTVVTKDIAPTTTSIRVTDFTSGESVKTTTTTSPTGVTTVRRSVRGVGGTSVSPTIRTRLITATKPREIEILRPRGIIIKRPQRLREPSLIPALKRPTRLTFLEKIKRKKSEAKRLLFLQQKKARELERKGFGERTKTQKAITKFGGKIENVIEKLRQKALRLSPSFRREADQRLLDLNH